MDADKTVTMSWVYATPCQGCGKDIIVRPDPSGGDAKFDGGPQRLTCKACGHEDEYPPSSIDNKLSG